MNWGSGRIGGESSLLDLFLREISRELVDDGADHLKMPQLLCADCGSPRATSAKKLKAAGISVAIDHFGAGFAGLLLLSRFQPDRIKISQELITNVHKSGPRQAIIQAIIKCCTSLEIQVSAMGVATPEEWMWLESAGIEMFQGDLFAKAKLNGIPSIAWPEKK